METFSALLALRAGNSLVIGGFPSQRPTSRSFDEFFDLLLNKRLSKLSRRRWLETPLPSLWRHCNVQGGGHSDYSVVTGYTWGYGDSLRCIQWLQYSHLDYLPIPMAEYDFHSNDVIMSAKASQITSLMIVYSTVYSSTDQRKHQSFASLASVRGSHRWPVNSPYKGPVTLKMFPFDDVIMWSGTRENG